MLRRYAPSQDDFAMTIRAPARPILEHAATLNWNFRPNTQTYAIFIYTRPRPYRGKRLRTGGNEFPTSSPLLRGGMFCGRQAGTISPYQSIGTPRTPKHPQTVHQFFAAIIKPYLSKRRAQLTPADRGGSPCQTEKLLPGDLHVPPIVDLLRTLTKTQVSAAQDSSARRWRG